MSELQTEEERLAREAYQRLTGNKSFEDWIAVGRKLREITEQVMSELNLPEWDPNNRRLKDDATARFEAWERSFSNAEVLTKQERQALRELMTKPEITEWYRTLPEPNRRRLCHPHSVINRWKAMKRGPPIRIDEENAVRAMAGVLRTNLEGGDSVAQEEAVKLFRDYADDLKIAAPHEAEVAINEAKIDIKREKIDSIRSKLHKLRIYEDVLEDPYIRTRLEEWSESKEAELVVIHKGALN